MPTDTKSAIIDSIRRNLAASRPHDAERLKHRHAPAVVSAAISPPQPDSEKVLENFRASLEFVGATFHRAEDERAAATIVRKLIEERNVSIAAFSDSKIVGRVVESIEDAATFIYRAAADELFEAEIGITSARFGIAETGTLVLDDRSERNRLTSLVPPVHVCIIEADSLRPTLGEVLRELGPEPSRAITFITGASRTSDIELTLAIGVHGPGELIVILVDSPK